MATVPLSGTNIRLLSGVPFSNDYKNTRWFDTKTQQTNYFNGKTRVHTMNEANFQRIEGYNFIAVDKSIDELWGTNYLMFQNASYNNKWFYAFVTKLEYRQRKTTYVHFQIDVFQTWRFDMNFKPSFVVREHCPLWNSNGSPVVNTIDEGLDYGQHYETVSVENYVPLGDVFFLVIVAKQRMDTNSSNITPSLNGSPQPLSYYVHPFRLDGSSPSITIGGESWALSNVNDVMKAIYTFENAVNNVVSLYITEHIGQGTLNFNISRFDPVTIQEQVPNASGSNRFQTLYVKDVPSYSTNLKSFGNKYNDFKPVKESKLLMYPYALTILDDFKGNKAVIKNEYIDSTSLAVTVRGSIGVSNKVAYSVVDYLTKELNDTGLKRIVSLETSLINNSPNDVPIITDLLSAYLQGNKNTLENQKNSIMFNGVTGMVQSGISGVASAVARNPVGVASAGTGIIQGAGSTVLQLQGLEAKQKDIDNVPPQMTKMGSNTAFDFGNHYKGIFVVKKQITEEYRRKLTHFFNMFGYKVNEVKIPNFHTRRYWNYVQTSSCIITGNFNNEDLQELKGVFDNGITLWHTDDVGNYSLENEVI